MNTPTWAPFPGPQTAAMNSGADELLVGSADGYGKTDLLLGLALTRASTTLYLRRHYEQLAVAIRRAGQLTGKNGQWRSGNTLRFGERTINFDACPNNDGDYRFSARVYSLIVIDELAEFTRNQFRLLRYMVGTCNSNERTRLVCTTSALFTPAARWITHEWAPWLDPNYPDRDIAGELRWFSYQDGQLCWHLTGSPVTYRGHTWTPKSRSFIPMTIRDNPALLQHNELFYGEPA